MGCDTCSAGYTTAHAYNNGYCGTGNCGEAALNVCLLSGFYYGDSCSTDCPNGYHPFSGPTDCFCGGNPRVFCIRD